MQTASPFWRSGSRYLGAMHFLWQAVVSLQSINKPIFDPINFGNGSSAFHKF
jgi:hypothetical protein